MPFTEPTSVTSGTPASSSSTTASAIAPTGSATNARSAPRAASRDRPGDLGDRAQLPSPARVVRRRGRIRPRRGRPRRSASPIEPPIRPVPMTATRTPPTRGDRRGASARLRGTRGAGRRAPGRRRSASSPGSCWCMPCTMPSSRAQRSGTSPSPSARAAVAGNSAVRSSVAVKMMLTRSSWPIALRSSISRDEALRLRVDLRLGVLDARRRTSQCQQSHGSARLLGGLLRTFERGGVQRPHLLRASAPATAPGASCGSRNGPMRVRTSRTTG